MKINQNNGKNFTVLNDEFTDYLLSLNLFDNIEKKGAHGESDVITYKNNFTFIFSLKCIKYDEKHYNQIDIEEFYPKICLARRTIERYKKEASCFAGIFDVNKNKFDLKLIDLKFPAQPIKIFE